MRTTKLVSLLIAGMAASAPASRGAPTPGSVAAAVADRTRSASQVAADADRRPAETLALAGVRPGMVVGEFYPGGGYYTHLLSDVIGPRGHVYGLENAGWDGAVTDDRSFVAAKRLSNVSIEGAPIGTVLFPVPLDVAWITQNYHDLKVAEFGHVDTLAFDRAVFAALKPGGVFLVVDHRARPGTNDAGIARLHRIDDAQVVREIEAAGFRLAAEGDFLRQPADDHTLPVSDRRIKGHTDQFVLKFVKHA